ncbi:MAG TPA: hypothetical protein VEV15_02355 [Flavisolibacter sp.]|nr:hypothetical protein [Flavisolibacter sp.]
MKRFPLLILSCVLFQNIPAQPIDLKDLDGLLDFNQAKLEAHLQKKGFNHAGYFAAGGELFIKTKKEKKDSAIRYFQIEPNEFGYDLIYTTNSQQEYFSLQTEMNASGFSHSARKMDNAGSVLYQKKELAINCSSQQVDSSLLYIIRATKKPIPRLKNIRFAEDLLQLDSHEYLVEVFGRQNVKKDSFYFSATESKKCTVIFPNTSRQAIFIWNDEENFRKISFIIIGEQVNKSDEDINTVILSDWKSKQGLYCGMSLKEVQTLNKGPIRLYNWRTQSAGLLAPKNKGAIDFGRLMPVFNCMNCGFLFVDPDVDVIQSNNALDENQKVYVASFAVLPEKKPEISNQTSLK